MLLHYQILILASTIIWLFPPIRQYKQNYFWLFFVLAITDPLSHLFARQLGFIPSQFYVLFTTLFFFSLIDFKGLNLYKIAFYLVLIFLSVFSFVNFWEFSTHYIVVTFSLILFIITKNSILFVVNTGAINTFHIVLIFYILSNILKFWNTLAQFETGIVFFYITTWFQVLVGLFFSIYKEDNPKLLIKIGG
ncbi:MAG: hypothetical protein FD143_2624 [Ignavibacteria bacterium]|nr:MAG: hypothetical protein FD143_2624 [Ignavibacteria bacterium]KAF0156905.1 MAG: hypothetical protein FD188_2866 [Ignavibacteria bacterium]